MLPSVRAAFSSFSTRFEGRVAFMYLDIEALVTIGIGNLIDPVDAALRLPFVHKSDLQAATQAEMEVDWHAIKGRPDLATARDRLRQCDAITALKLTDDGIDELVMSKLDSNEHRLKQTAEFSNLDDWPADAQLGLFSIAWAAGPAFGAGFPKFRAACASRTWDEADAQSHIDDSKNPGLTPRNDANRILFSNAAQVVQRQLDVSVLQYPRDLAAGDPPAGSGGASPPAVDGLSPTSGRPGDTVVITGQGFTDASSVGFGETSVAAMSVDSDNQITVTAPAGGGTVSVTVITPAGTSAPSSTAEFVYA